MGFYDFNTNINRPYFKHHLKMGDVYLYVNSAGGVVPSASPVPISYDPIGWDENELKFVRNLIQFGVERNYSLLYKYVKDAAKILRFVLYTYGKEKSCQLVVYRLNKSTQTYTHYYTGDIDFTTASDERDFFSVGNKEAGVAADIKANEDTTYEMAVNSSNRVIVDIDPLLVDGEITFITAPLQTNFPNAPDGPEIEITDRRTLYLIAAQKTFVPVSTSAKLPVELGQLDTSNTPLPGISEGQYPVGWFNGNFLLNATSRNPCLFTAKVDVYNVIVSGALPVTITNNSGYDMTFRWGIEKETLTGSTFSWTYYFSSSTYFIADGDPQQVFTLPLDVAPIDLVAGERIRLFFDPQGLPLPPSTNGGYFIEIHDQENVKVTFQHYTQPFTVKGIRYNDACSFLVDKISNGTASFSSDLLTDTSATYPDGIDNRPVDTIILSGDSIRNAIYSLEGSPINPVPVLVDPKIKMKWSDAFKDANSLWSIGIGIENDNVVRLEKKSYFFDKNTTYHLPEAASVTVAHASQYYYNSMKIGSPNQTYDNVNGRDEFNTTQIFTFQINRVKNELDLVSPWRHDMYGIFYTWVQYVLLQSVDSSSDNDVFVMEIDPDSAVIIDGETHYSPKYWPTEAAAGDILGVVDPARTFNIGLSPHRSLRRNGAFIRSWLVGQEDKTIKFQSTDKNPNLFATLSGPTEEENSDILISSLANPLFLPHELTVQVETTEPMIEVFENNPKQKFITMCEGVEYRGYCLGIGVKPAKPDLYTMKLMAAEDMDLNALIR